MLVIVLSAQRFGNVLDWAGPNVASNQIIVYTPNGQGGPPPGGGNGQPVVEGNAGVAGTAPRTPSRPRSARTRSWSSIQPNASLNHAASGRQWTGAIYLATPQLLHAFGIPASQVDPNADILSMRPGLSGLGKMQLNFARKGSGAQSRPGRGRPAGPAGPVLPPVPTGRLPGQPGDPGGRARCRRARRRPTR